VVFACRSESAHDSHPRLPEPVCEHLARHICTDTGTVANPVAKVALSRGGVAEEPDEKVASSTIHIAIRTCAGTSFSPDETVFAAKRGLADSSIAASTYPATRLTVRAFQYIGTDYHTHH